MEKSNNKKYNLLLFATIIEGIVIIGLCIFFFHGCCKNSFNNDNDCNKVNNSDEKETSSDVQKEESEKDVYKSNDGSHTLLFIDNDNADEYNKVLKEYENIAGKLDGEIHYFGYYDNSPFVILNQRNAKNNQNDIYYSIVANVASESKGVCGSRINIVYNIKTKEIVYPTFDSKIDDEIGSLCESALSAIKYNDKYFFLKISDDMLRITIYTEDWKRIGYAKFNIEYYDGGFYYYDNELFEGGMLKYAIK